MVFESVLNNINEEIQLTEAEQEFFSSKLTKKEIEKKKYLLRSGNICYYRYYIIRGCVKKYYINEEGKERIFRFAIEDQWIGDVNSFDSKTASIFNIIALEETEVLQLEKSAMDELLEEVPKLERYFRILAIENQKIQQKRIKQNLSCNAEERYEDFREDYSGLELRVSQKEIASYLGVTPQFLSKLRARLARTSQK